MPATFAAGDLLIAMAQKTTQNFGSVPSTWTQIATNRTLIIYAKEATGSDTITVTANSATYLQGYVVAIQEADVDVVNLAADTAYVAYNAGGSPTTIDSPAVVVATTGSFVMRIGVVESPQQEFVIPSGTTADKDINGSASGVSAYFAYDTSTASAGAGSAATWTGMSGSLDKVAATLVIPPAGSSASAIPAFVHHRRLLGVQ